MAEDWIMGSDAPTVRRPRFALGRYRLEQSGSTHTCIYSLSGNDVVAVGADNSFVRGRENELAWRRANDTEACAWKEDMHEDYPYPEAFFLATASEAASMFDLGIPTETTSAYDKTLGRQTEINTYSDGSTVVNDLTSGHVVAMDSPSFTLRFVQFWAE